MEDAGENAGNAMLTLRRTVNVVTVVAAIGLVGGLGFYKVEEARRQAAVDDLAGDVSRFEQMVKLRAATKDVELNGRGWPVTIDPAWFDGDPPRNRLLTGDRPWVEVARPEDAHLRDPVVRVALDERFASFWYNPYQGIVRARVPLEINDKLTLDLYNTVNGTALTTIYQDWSVPVHAPAEEPNPPTPEPDTTAAVEPDDPNSESALDPTRAPDAPAGAATPPAETPKSDPPPPPRPR